MPNYLIQRSTTVGAEWAAHANAIFTDLVGHAATTPAEIASRLSLDLDLTSRVLAAMDRAGAIWRGHDCAGAEFLWSVAGAQMTVFEKMADARAWLETHDGSTAEDLATDLGVHQAIAIKLAQVMAAESDVKLTAI